MDKLSSPLKIFVNMRGYNKKFCDHEGNFYAEEAAELNFSFLACVLIYIVTAHDAGARFEINATMVYFFFGW